MESIYNFRDFRKFLRHCFEARAKNGFGEASKLAKALNVNNTFVSQILAGNKSLSPEQGMAAAEHLNLNDLETEYLILLVQFDRAGTKQYKKFVEKQLTKLKGKSEELVNRVRHDIKISEEQRATFYSDWVYSALRLSTLLPNLKTPETLSQHYGLPIAKVKEVVDFLLQTQLLVLERGELSLGVRSTHLEASSPWIKSHHANWRQKALQDLSLSDPKSLHYSAPMTLTSDDAEKIREILIQSINSVDAILGPSPSEELHCLTIDWFKVRGT